MEKCPLGLCQFIKGCLLEQYLDAQTLAELLGTWNNFHRQRPQAAQLLPGFKTKAEKLQPGSSSQFTI